MKYSGRTVKDLPACVEYLIACHDNKTGGFAPTPDGEANLSNAAQGLVAIAELNMSANDLKKAGLKFLQSQVSKGQNHEPK